MDQAPTTDQAKPDSWVDPRLGPKPPAPAARCAPVDDPREVADLIKFCGDGRIYEIEKWIIAGRPLQSLKYDIYRRGRLETPLETAISKGLYDVALLLLCNGYRLDLEADARLYCTPLDQALQARAWNFVELLLEWGADPCQVDADSVFSTYRVDLMDRFWSVGLDFVKDHTLARHLSEHSSNRPLYGWTRRHRSDPRIQRDLDIALLHAVNEKREKVVHLLLWAGANPRARVPDLRWMDPSGEDGAEEDCSSAIEGATSFGRSAMLRALKLDPERDDFGVLYASADTVDALKHLLAIQPPADWSAAILNNLSRLRWPFPDGEAKACLDFIASQGGRLGHISPERCADVRSYLLKLTSESDLQSLLRWLSNPECCEPATYAEITRTPAMKTKLRQISKGDERRRRGW